MGLGQKGSCLLSGTPQGESVAGVILRDAVLMSLAPFGVKRGERRGLAYKSPATSFVQKAKGLLLAVCCAVCAVCFAVCCVLGALCCVWCALCCVRCAFCVVLCAVCGVRCGVQAALQDVVLPGVEVVMGDDGEAPELEIVDEGEGEGSQLDVVARATHRATGAGERPCLTLPCPALPFRRSLPCLKLKSGFVLSGRSEGRL